MPGFVAQQTIDAGTRADVQAFFEYFTMDALLRASPVGLGRGLLHAESILQENELTFGNLARSALHREMSDSVERPPSAVGVGGLTPSQVEAAEESLRFVFRVALRQGAGAEEFRSALEKETDLSERARTAMTRLWRAREEASPGAALARPLLRAGRFLGLDATVGLAVGSSSRRELHLPLVELSWSVEDTHGNFRTVTTELTLEEFRQLRQESLALQGALERL